MFETVKKYVPLQWDLLANPINWVIVVLMVAIAGMGLAYIFPAKSSKSEQS